MSQTAAWSYTNSATVKPFVSKDQWGGGVTYGTPYEIACTWEADNSLQRDANGAEFVGRHTFYTEDARPKPLDMIQRAGAADWEEIRSRLEWDMSPFAEAPDYKLVT